MDKELTKKITDSIKKKLKELQGGVIAGLPDYVLVMAANKKTETQIAQDLKVFLGASAPEFAEWLIKLLQELKYYVSDESKVKEELVKDEPEEIDGEAEEDILKLTEQEQLETDDLIPKDETDIFQEANEILQPESETSASVNLSPLKTSEKPIEVPSKLDKNDISPQKKSNKPKSKVTVSSADNEYDPLFPSIAPSQIMPRKSSVPLNMQANKLLLLKAIDDANASVNGKDAINQIYNPTPIKVLTAENRKKSNSSPSRKKIVRDHTPTWDMNDMELDFEGDDNIFCTDKNSKTSYNNLLYPVVFDSAMDGVEPFNHREVVINDFAKANENYLFNGSEDEEYFVRPVSPRFVVTLDGVPDNLKRKRSFSDTSDKSAENVDPLEVIEQSDEKSTLETEEVLPKKQKIMERCKFWPACKNSDNCEYHHPCVPCKLFPLCKFGDKCLYIHPNCKFDSRCTRKDCPYTHVSKRDFSLIHASIGFAPKLAMPTSPTVCKFYPNCTVYPCPYLHPKKCRFGSDCNSPNCQFLHQNYPSRKQLKWKASLST